MMDRHGLPLQKFFNLPPDKRKKKQACYYLCPSNCPVICLPALPPLTFFPPPPTPSPRPPSPPLPSPPPPPPPLPSPSLSSTENYSHRHISLLIIIIISILAVASVLVVFSAAVIKFTRRSRNRFRRASPAPPAEVVEEDGFDDQTTPDPLDLIWYVRTVGLEESAINSIAAFRYRRGDGVVDGTVCSVCLSEFQEEESLRILPKCRHAFHLPCIDSWLNHHVNCPLCRSIVAVAPPPPSEDPSSNSSRPPAEFALPQTENHGRISAALLELGISNRSSSALAVSDQLLLPSPRRSWGFRAFSDLGPGIRWPIDSSAAAMAEEQMDKQAWRSISMVSLPSDRPSGPSVLWDESSKGREADDSKKTGSSGDLSGVKRIILGTGGSKWRVNYLQKGPVLMKRFFSRRRSRRWTSVLPL